MPTLCAKLGFAVLCLCSVFLRVCVRHLCPSIQLQLKLSIDVQIKPWKLEDGDHTLLDLMPFLEAIYKANVPDVREVVAAYDGQDIPTAFR